MADPPVLIVGAGLGGLTTALALLQHGIPTIVAEQAPELGEVGAGITMWPNATLVLENLGLREQLAAIAFVPASLGVRHYRTGELLRRSIGGSDLREVYGAPQYFLHRADLQQLLAEAVRTRAPDAIRLDHALVALDQDAGGVDAHFANGATIRARALIGCDGIHSVTRHALFGPDQPRWTGIVAYRSLVPMERLPSDILDPVSCIFPGPSHYFVRYPVRGGTLMNYVAFAAHVNRWSEESWRARATVDEIRAEFAGWHRRVQAVLDATTPDQCFKWALHDRDPIERWSAGRISLLGDAAHPALPFLGQGAAMAIEDAIVVARCLDAIDDVATAFERFQALRQDRTRWVQIESRENGQRELSDPDPLYQSGEAQRVNQKLEAFRRYDASTIPLDPP
ncbi:MAG: FAD-dependent monooxygenase [Dehalococcoidia bacterium]